MLDLMAEGFGAIRLACTLAVLVPGIGATLVSRNRAWQAVVAFTLGAGLIGWARFADLWFAPPSAMLLVVLGLAVAGTLALAWNDTRFAPLTGATAGIVAGWMWVPCVGEHLAVPLNEAATNRAGTFGPLMAYLVGVSIPLIVAAVLPYAVPWFKQWRDHEAAAKVGIVVGGIVALAIAAGFYGDIIVALAPDVI